MYISYILYIENSIYIIVGLSALLSLTSRAMREPQHVDWAKDWLHVFLLYVLTLKPLTSAFGVGWKKKETIWRFTNNGSERME